MGLYNRNKHRNSLVKLSCSKRNWISKFNYIVLPKSCTSKNIEMEKDTPTLQMSDAYGHVVNSSH